MSAVEFHRGSQARLTQATDLRSVDQLLADLKVLRETVFQMERRGDPPDHAEETFRRVLDDAAQLILE